MIEVIERELFCFETTLISGKARVNIGNNLFENETAIDMALDVLSDRGFRVNYLRNVAHVPVHFDGETGAIQCREQLIHQFEIKFSVGDNSPWLAGRRLVDHSDLMPIAVQQLQFTVFYDVRRSSLRFNAAPDQVRRLVIVGGGIGGLAAAWYAQAAGFQVTVYEAGLRFGGVIASEMVDDCCLELGPDSFCNQTRWDALLKELGLADKVNGAAAGTRVLIARGKRLRPVPDGFYLIAPGKSCRLPGRLWCRCLVNCGC